MRMSQYTTRFGANEVSEQLDNTHCVWGHISTVQVIARMPAKPLIQCHGLCGTCFVRPCSSQYLDIHFKHTGVYFALCINCLYRRVGFVFRKERHCSYWDEY